ncbi:MAG: histidine phosphatase family protein [Opitutae bacterium]
MRIIFVRHGESEANVAGIISDDPNRQVALTDTGRNQAQVVAGKLSHIPFIHAYTSEFLRARQTAEILLIKQMCPLLIDARLNERQSGMDGLPVEVFNGLVRAEPVRTRPPGGESFLEQMERLKAFLDDIAAVQPDGPVLAVSHENPILAALTLSGQPVEETVRGSIPNCGWVEIHWPLPGPLGSGVMTHGGG